MQTDGMEVKQGHLGPCKDIYLQHIRQCLQCPKYKHFRPCCWEGGDRLLVLALMTKNSIVPQIINNVMGSDSALETKNTDLFAKLATEVNCA